MNNYSDNELSYLQSLPTAALKELSGMITNMVMYYTHLPNLPPKFVFDMQYHQREIITILEKRIETKLAEGY